MDRSASFDENDIVELETESQLATSSAAIFENRHEVIILYGMVRFALKICKPILNQMLADKEIDPKIETRNRLQLLVSKTGISLSLAVNWDSVMKFGLRLDIVLVKKLTLSTLKPEVA